MNERIKQLMAQAGTDVSGKWMGVEHAEKLAALILQDCIDQVNTCSIRASFTTGTDFEIGFDKGVLKVMQQLKTYFDVK